MTLLGKPHAHLRAILAACDAIFACDAVLRDARNAEQRDDALEGFNEAVEALAALGADFRIQSALMDFEAYHTARTGEAS